jgi:hypothetical protein
MRSLAIECFHRSECREEHYEQCMLHQVCACLSVLLQQHRFLCLLQVIELLTTFSGFRSLCMILWLWQKAVAHSNCSRHSSVQGNSEGQALGEVKVCM